MKTSTKFKLINDLPKETFYIYCFINPYTNLPFYLGKGKNHRYRDHFTESVLSKGNMLKNNTIKKILKKGSKVLIQFLFSSTNEKEVLTKEANYIKKYGRIDLKTGTLTNLTEGGEGTSGKVFTEKELEACRKRCSGKGNPMYGKKRTEEEKQSISQTRKERILSGEIIPTKHSEEWRLHLKEDNAGGKATAKPILQICSTTGLIVKEWVSCSQAAKSLNGVKTNISAAATTYKNRISYGFYWRYKNDILDINPNSISEFNSNRLKPNNPYGVKGILKRK